MLLQLAESVLGLSNMIQYKFLKIRTNQGEEEVNSLLNQLASEGWRVMNFFPTSDNELGKNGILNKNEAWDVGYAFLLVKEN